MISPGVSLLSPACSCCTTTRKTIFPFPCLLSRRNFVHVSGCPFSLRPVVNRRQALGSNGAWKRPGQPTRQYLGSWQHLPSQCAPNPHILNSPCSLPSAPSGAVFLLGYVEERPWWPIQSPNKGRKKKASS